MKRRAAGLVVLTLQAITAGSHPTLAQEPTERGRELVRLMEDQASGYGDYEGHVLLRISGGEGDDRVREMTIRGLETDDGARSLIELERPADLSGTAFLSVLGDDGERSLWIYLPSARRVRRIGGARASDPFLGSHFTYEGLSPPAVEGYDYRWIRETAVGGRAGAVVERRSRAEDGRRELLWIDTERHLLHRVEFFDAGGVRTRILELADYREIDGHWWALRMVMSQVDGDGRSVLEWSDLKLGVGLRERDFDPRRLGG